MKFQPRMMFIDEEHIGMCSFHPIDEDGCVELHECFHEDNKNQLCTNTDCPLAKMTCRQCSKRQDQTVSGIMEEKADGTTVQIKTFHYCTDTTIDNPGHQVVELDKLPKWCPGCLPIKCSEKKGRKNNA
jgi:hypothetical protein